VTSLDQLSLAEFNGAKAMPKVNENNHKNVIQITNWYQTSKFGRIFRK
jgi:hypothetical protein